MLREDLYRFRDLIDQYHADKGKLPGVAGGPGRRDGYLRKIPIDPFTRQADWQEEPGGAGPRQPRRAAGHLRRPQRLARSCRRAGRPTANGEEAAPMDRLRGGGSGAPRSLAYVLMPADAPGPAAPVRAGERTPARRPPSRRCRSSTSTASPTRRRRRASARATCSTSGRCRPRPSRRRAADAAADEADAAAAADHRAHADAACRR